jgi:CHASE2 domain-containing sensor protein
MTERPFPWSREVWALLLDRLFGAGARLVMFDMVFNNPNDGDPAFRAALDRYRDRVIIAMNVDMQDTAEMRRQEGTAPTVVFPNSQLIPEPAQKDDRVGFINYWNDVIDGKLRAARFFTSDRQLAGNALFPRTSEITFFVSAQMMPTFPFRCGRFSTRAIGKRITVTAQNLKTKS